MSIWRPLRSALLAGATSRCRPCASLIRRRRLLRPRDNALYRHHSPVLMSEDVAMKDEVADVRSAEVHECLDLWIRSNWIAVLVDAGRWVDVTVLWRRTTAERNFNHIQELAVDGWRRVAAILFEIVLR